MKQAQVTRAHGKSIPGSSYSCEFIVSCSHISEAGLRRRCHCFMLSITLFTARDIDISVLCNSYVIVDALPY
jgi:hypothetical protein